ncbi:MAG: hypothetical protein K0S51_2129 [Bacillales bacterium]|jgi:hypothetical protein|nr:hypothetical protein [Bacillales bacterium]
MILKSIDLSLMSEHMNVHKGQVEKLANYYCAAKDMELKEIIYNQYLIMKNHVKVMLLLMDPNQNESITSEMLKKVVPTEIPCQSLSIQMSEQAIATEGKNTAKTMAHDNFASALMMKANNVRDIHIHMALQQVMIQERYNKFTEKKKYEMAPTTTMQTQVETMQNFKKMYNIE